MNALLLSTVRELAHSHQPTFYKNNNTRRQDVRKPLKRRCHDRAEVVCRCSKDRHLQGRWGLQERARSCTYVAILLHSILASDALATVELNRNVVEEMMVQKFRERIHSLSDEELSMATEKFLSGESVAFPKNVDLFRGNPNPYPLTNKSMSERKISVPEPYQNFTGKEKDIESATDKDFVNDDGGKIDEEVDETNSLLTSMGARPARKRDPKQGEPAVAVPLAPESSSEDPKLLTRVFSLLRSLPYRVPQGITGFALLGAVFSLLAVQLARKINENTASSEESPTSTSEVVEAEKPSGAALTVEKQGKISNSNPRILWQRKESDTVEENRMSNYSQNDNNVIWRRTEDRQEPEVGQADNIDLWRVPLEQLRGSSNDSRLITTTPKEDQDRHTPNLRPKIIGHKKFKGSALDNAEPPDLEQEIDMDRVQRS